MSTVYLPIELAGVCLLIEARAVQEVLGRRDVVRVPHATLQLPGVFPWQGLAIPLIDVAQAMELGRGAKEREKARRRTVVVRVDDELAGLTADDVREVVTLEASNLRPIHAAPRPFAHAEVDWSGAVATIVDLPALLSGAFERVGRKA